MLFNGKVLTVDKDFSAQQALAIGDGKVLATGSSAAMKKLAGKTAKTRRSRWPHGYSGLTDGHIHGIRAALTFGTEVNWIGVPTLKEALEKISHAAKTQKPGSWIVVAGGWTEEQFAEKRRPTAEEVAAVAPDHPVYIQHLYDWLLLTPTAMEALDIHDDFDVTPGGKLERDSDNKPTGVVIANGNALGRIFDKLPKPTMEQQVDGSRKFFSEMNSLGITGIVDGGGVSMYPANYQAVFKLWHDRQLTVRVAYHLCAPKPGSELADLQNLTQLLTAGVWRLNAAFQRPWRDLGLGRLDRWRHHAGWQGEACRIAALGGVEALHHSDPLKCRPHRRQFARHGRGHRQGFSGSRAPLDRAASLQCLRGHLKRMKALGLVWGVQDGLYFGGERLQHEVGVDQARMMPRTSATAMKLGPDRRRRHRRAPGVVL